MMISVKKITGALIVAIPSLFFVFCGIVTKQTVITLGIRFRYVDDHNFNMFKTSEIKMFLEH